MAKLINDKSFESELIFVADYGKILMVKQVFNGGISIVKFIEKPLKLDRLNDIYKEKILAVLN